ncbi:MAG: VOC family protein [Acidobacteriota bacterium]|nr:VOC family protein [Acidobacteriota bacterium]
MKIRLHTLFLLLTVIATIQAGEEEPPLADAHEMVIRVTVSDMKKSLAFYVDQLGLTKTDEIYDEWAKLLIPGNKGTALGLKLVIPPEGSGGEVTTFVVKDIRASIAKLRARGIEVEDPRHLAGGVLLAFFEDPDKNRLAVRQNP